MFEFGIIDIDVKYLCNIFWKKMNNLTTLEIILADNNVGDEGLLNLIEITKVLKNLEWFVVNLYDNKIKYVGMGNEMK